MKIGEALDKIGYTTYLTILGECTLEEASEKMSKMPQIRGIYVLDKQGRLEGYLSLGVLIRDVIAARYRYSFHVRSLLARITSEKVADIMDENIIFAQKGDDIKKVLDLMVNRNIKEIPVVDEERHIIASLGIIDLWKLVEK
ncbi:MAG TPA: CBS domain-containing protein [Deltaproteobacteria bacterium]|nr:CBS domain-containing protein [Deltaproteobacteria bacterium]